MGLRLDLPARSTVVDLLSGEVAGPQALSIGLAGERGRLLHVQPMK